MKVLLLIAKSGTGGIEKRLIEVLRRCPLHGIRYVVALDKECWCRTKGNFSWYFDSIKELDKIHNFYLTDLERRLKTQSRSRLLDYFSKLISEVLLFTGAFVVAGRIASLAEKHDVDLIACVQEDPHIILATYLTASFSKKPWTTILQLMPMALNLSLPCNEPLSNIRRSALNQMTKAFNSRVLALWRFLKLMFVTWILNKTIVLSVSPHLADDFQKLNAQLRFYNVNPGNGVDLERIATIRPVNEKFEAVFVARLTREKGFLDLPLAWKEVIDHVPNAKFAVAGYAQDLETLSTYLKLVNELELEQNMRYVGYLKDWDEVIALLKASSVLIYPSYLDAFPIIILEALACGIPVVAYDIPAIRENYGSCKAVIRVPIGDYKAIARSVVEFLQNNNESSRHEAITFAQRYSWESVIEAEKRGYMLLYVSR